MSKILFKHIKTNNRKMLENTIKEITINKIRMSTTNIKNKINITID